MTSVLFSILMYAQNGGAVLDKRMNGGYLPCLRMIQKPPSPSTDL